MSTHNLSAPLPRSWHDYRAFAYALTAIPIILGLSGCGSTQTAVPTVTATATAARHAGPTAAPRPTATVRPPAKPTAHVSPTASVAAPYRVRAVLTSANTATHPARVHQTLILHLTVVNTGASIPNLTVTFDSTTGKQPAWKLGHILPAPCAAHRKVLANQAAIAFGPLAAHVSCALTLEVTPLNTGHLAFKVTIFGNANGKTGIDKANGQQASRTITVLPAQPLKPAVASSTTYACRYFHVSIAVPKTWTADRTFTTQNSICTDLQSYTSTLYSDPKHAAAFLLNNEEGTAAASPRIAILAEAANFHLITPPTSFQSLHSTDGPQLVATSQSATASSPITYTWYFGAACQKHYCVTFIGFFPPGAPENSAATLRAVLQSLHFLPGAATAFGS